MKIYMLIKSKGIWDEIESITCEDSEGKEYDSIRNCYNMRREGGFKWKVEIIDMEGID